MRDLTLIVGTSDPATLYSVYQALSIRYDEAGAQLDELQTELDAVEEDDVEEREHLAAEVDRLGIGRSVLLGWVSAYYAAYTFAHRGTSTPWLVGGVPALAGSARSPETVRPRVSIGRERTVQP